MDASGFNRRAQMKQEKGRCDQRPASGTDSARMHVKPILSFGAFRNANSPCFGKIFLAVVSAFQVRFQKKRSKISCRNAPGGGCGGPPPLLHAARDKRRKLVTL
jgi:hypothetical protein